MNNKHFPLLEHLRKNSREKLTTISKKTSIPISTLFDQLKEIQGSLISKSTVLLNYDNLGYHTRAQVFIKVDNEDKEKLRKHLLCNNCINSIFKINNGWNFIIETVHKNVKDLDTFLEKLQDEYKITDKQIHYLIEEVKREGFELTQKI